MTAAQRRITFAICVIVGLSLLMAAGLTFLVSPMAEGLGLGDDAVEDILAIPSVAALVAVFSAGQLGDRVGHRRTLVIASLGFTAGAVILASAMGVTAVEIGLAICAASAITMQIVGVSVLQLAMGRGPAQVSAFTTYGMVFPLAFLVLPVATASLLGVANWRLVPAIWAITGLIIWITASLLLEADQPVGATGEWITPLLAGIALAGAARVLSELGQVYADPSEVGLAALVAVTAATGCLILCRRLSRPNFSLRSVQSPMLRILLLGVMLVSFVGLLTYVTIALEYFYDMTPLESSIAIIPAQLGAVLGAKVLAMYAIHRWGGDRASRYLMMAIAMAMLPLVLVRSDTPAWFLVAVATVFSCAQMAALTAVNTVVMSRAPRESTAAVSSIRTAASSIGGALGVGVFGAIIITSVQVDAGVADVSALQLDHLAASLRLVGVLASLIAVTGWFSLTLAERRLPAQA